MKTLMFLVGVLVLTGGVLFAVTQPNSIGLVTAIIENKTIAQIDALSAKGAGQLVFCTDCVRSAICVSSGTGRGAWTIVAGTGTFVAGVKEDCR